MTLRLLEILVPDRERGEVLKLLEDAAVVDVWHEPVLGERLLVRVLVQAEETEPVLDLLEKRFAHLDAFRAVILPVAATVPRPPEPEEEEREEEEAPDRISRDELLDALAGGTRVTSTFVALVVLSAIVAALGLLKDNTAVVIGAMVIAPLLTPNMALALATTLGDFTLMRRTIRTNLAGIAIALALSVAVGAVLEFDPSQAEFAGRTTASLGDTVLALAAGTAGALAFTTGVSAGLVGVMVAVALLPPLVVCGVCLGAGEPRLAWGAFLLLATNIICVNLAGVVTFLSRGVRPRTWWEADKARRATRRAVVIWASLLVALAVLIVLSF